MGRVCCFDELRQTLPMSGMVDGCLEAAERDRAQVAGGQRRGSGLQQQLTGNEA